MSESVIRPYRPSDRADVYDVCIRTGPDTSGWRTAELVPDVYAGPYLTLEPGLAFVLDTGDRVAGYILAAADTRDFVDRYRRDWLPRFSAVYPRPTEPSSAEEKLVESGWSPEQMIVPDVDAYPAHLHIDLLPSAQGAGHGRALMRTLLAALADRGVPAVHLRVSPANTGAVAFYRRLGFRPLPNGPDDGSQLGIRTDAEL